MREIHPLAVAYFCAVGGAFLPLLLVFQEIPPIYFFFCGLFLIVALLRRGKELSLGLQLFLILPALGFTFTNLALETLIPVLSGFLLVLQIAKFLGPRTPRDLLQIFLLNALLLVGAVFLRFDLLYAGCFFLEVFFTVGGLFFLFASREIPRLSISSARALGLVSVGASLAVLVLTIFYFLILPRAQFTLFSLPTSTGLTGVSDRVAPGEVSALKEDRSVAFRVRWLWGKRPQRPYFRVYVYNLYRQGVWESRLPRRGKAPEGPADFEVEVLPEVTGPGLPVPGYALKVISLKGPRAEPLSEGLVHTREEILEPALYLIQGRLAPYPPDLPVKEFLSVPAEIRRALGPLAESLRRKSPAETVAAAVAYLQKHYAYTLSPGKPQGEPLLWFLFSSRRGHCEYFAGALTFILRTLGIPARVVGGYAGGEWNPLGGYYILRQSEAHTWVEYYDPAQGWLPVDPTPPAGRIQARPSRLRLLEDYLAFKWYYWVLEYNFQKQRRLFLKVSQGLSKLPYSVLRLRFSPGLLFLALLPLLFWTLRCFRKIQSPAEELVKLLEKQGYPRRPGETFKTYTQRLSQKLPHLAPELRTFAELYYQEVYGGRNTREAQKKLLRDLRSKIRVVRF